MRANNVARWREDNGVTRPGTPSPPGCHVRRPVPVPVARADLHLDFLVGGRLGSHFDWLHQRFGRAFERNHIEVRRGEQLAVDRQCQRR